jgi:uncharacterized protein (DUF433 family)
MTEDRQPCWKRGDLFAALDAYLSWLESRAELSPVTRYSHWRYAGIFVRSLYAEYAPRTGEPRADPYPSSYCLSAEDIERELAAYGAWLGTSQLERRGIPTHVEGASLFVSWLVGRKPRRRGGPARGELIRLPNAVAPPPRPREPAPDWSRVIKIVAGKRGGRPTIRGLRITVGDVLSLLAAGMTEDEILAEFPDLRLADIRAALAFAADRERSKASITP